MANNINDSGSLIFIPDITGFTKFVNETEISHSSHIISELLELLVDLNELDLSLSEVEGDALLFYRFGASPSADDIIRQSTRMFTRFHEHLRTYDRDRVCSCGACSTASQLSLKFIVHYGNLAKIKIKEHTKLHGEELISAHRLLKNNVKDDEYVLMTEKFLSHNDIDVANNSHSWIQVYRSTEKTHEGIEMDYRYFSLSPLLKEINEAPPREAIKQTADPIKLNIEINSPPLYVHSVVSNSSLRPYWQDGVRESHIEDPTKLERVGSKHKCVTENGDFSFLITGNSFDENSIRFSEMTEKAGPFREVFSIYKFDDSGSGTKLVLEIHYIPENIFKKLLFIILRNFFKKKIYKNLVSLKEYCESRYSDNQARKPVKHPVI